MKQCIIRKFLLKQLNNLLEDYKNNIQEAREKVRVWSRRSEAITNFLGDLSLKLEDNNLTEDELKSTLEGFSELVKSWK